MEHKLAQKAIEKKDEKRMSEDTPYTEDEPGINDAAPVPWTPYPFNSGQPRQHTAHIFEIPSLLFGGKPPSKPETRSRKLKARRQIASYIYTIL